MMLGSGGGGAGEYVDDIFGITLYTGNEGSKTVTTNIDLATDGGMLWGKSRDGAHAPFLYDTTRGVQNYLRADVNAGQVNLSTSLTAFSTSGFSLGSHVGLNDDVPNAAWSFKKVPGFFDFVTYTGNGSSNHQISHNLGSVPGCIMVKCTSESQDWMIYHVSTTDTAGPGGAYLKLNTDGAQVGSSGGYYNTTATSSVFTLGDSDIGNKNNASYVAYIFAGGQSTTDTAVDFDGTDDYLTIADNAAWDIGTYYTAECFFRIDALTGAGWDAIFGQWPNNNNDTANTWTLEYVGSDLRFYYNDATPTVQYVSLGSVSYGTNQNRWHHFAFCKDGSSTRLFVDGELKTTISNISLNAGDGSFNIGGNVASGGYINGAVSNVRITKDQALYTNNFNVPHDPLTLTSQGAISSNVKLLCCNGSTTTASTVTPATITANSSPSVLTNQSVFDDTAAHIFGKSGDEDVVKTGSYIGNGSSTGPEIDLGFEPQWLLIKNITASNRDWKVLDCMRGISSGYDDAVLVMNGYATETDESTLDITSTGFKITASNAHYNENGETIAYLAIRRPDGTVGKPATAGTEVFTPVKGSSGAPLFVTPHTVDFHFAKDWDIVKDWNVSSRLTFTRRLETNTNIIEDNNGYQVGDYQTGWGSYTGGDGSRMGYNFKRHAGFDAVTYKGSDISTASNSILPHNLGVRPEMVWIKQRDGSTRDWAVGCPDILGINNNTLALNQDYASGTSNVNVFADSAAAQSKTRVVLHGNENGVSSVSANYLMLLFASVSGISKIGTYAGSSGAVTVTCGFQPRFILLKVTNTTEDWIVFDTVMGIASGNDTRLRLNRDGAAVSTSDWVDLDSDGFTVNNVGSSGTNTNGNTYLFYAHA